MGKHCFRESLMQNNHKNIFMIIYTQVSQKLFGVKMGSKSHFDPIFPTEKALRKTPQGLNLLAERVGVEPTVVISHT